MFREAIAFTAGRTGFVPRLIEKDFSRLSEDLDFVIPTDPAATRTARRTAAAKAKTTVGALARRLAEFHEIAPLTGAGESTQYNAILGYTSLLGNQSETIRVEISLREPLLMPAAHLATHTLLLDPISQEALAPPIEVPCIARTEAIAENLRPVLREADFDAFDLERAFDTLIGVASSLAGIA